MNIREKMNIREIEKHYKMLKNDLEKFAERRGYKLRFESTPLVECVKVRFHDDINSWVCEVNLLGTDADIGCAIYEIEREAEKELTRMKKLIDKHDDSIDTLFYSTLYSDKKRAKYVPYALKIKDVIFNDPATIVFWADGTKTVVKAQDGEPFDPEKGLAMAISKKALGNQGNYYNVFTKWCPEEEEKPVINFGGKALAEAIRKFVRSDRELEDIMRENAKRIILQATVDELLKQTCDDCAKCLGVPNDEGNCIVKFVCDHDDKDIDLKQRACPYFVPREDENK